MAPLIISRSVENAGALQYHSAGSIPVGAFRKACERIEMEISEIKDYVSSELERTKQTLKSMVDYCIQSNNKENELSLVQFYNGMMVAYNNVLTTIDDLPGAH